MAHLHFQLPYHTSWGEKLCLCYRLSTGEAETADLSTEDGETWRGEIRTSAASESMTYRYQVRNEANLVLRTEEGEGRLLLLSGRSEVHLFDHWRDEPFSAAFRRSAFTECVFRAPHADEPATGRFLHLHALPPREGSCYGVAGSSKSMGQWDARQPGRMIRTGTYDWIFPLADDDFRNGAEYKYVLLSESDGNITAWENGGNRLLPAAADLPEQATLICRDSAARFPERLWRGAGMVIPVFSLRSEGSAGVGDFGDLYALVDTVARMGMSAIQVLPVNDTSATGTWSDSYPYNCLSVFALHPVYIDLREWRETEAFQACAERGKRLNALETLDYVAVMKMKTEFLRSLFDEIGTQTLNSPAYKDFFQENKQWLRPYSLFCHLRDRYETADFRQWGKYARYDEERLLRYLQENSEARRAADFYGFAQYLLYAQMARVRHHARELGIILKGDLPIGISPASVPAWVDGRLFHFDGQAGAPPDDFSANGQNWGFPTYDWEEMAKDGYEWWRRRIQQMARCFDAFRIDHVLGFFRIWEIPSEQISGVLGRFRPALPLQQAEIAAFGFKQAAEDLAYPSFSEEELTALCDKCGSNELRAFFEARNGGYALLPEADSQKKICERVKNKDLRQALMECVADVLFISDPERPGQFHPRIAPWNTCAFQRLDEADKQAFRRLHEHFFYHRHNAFWQEQTWEKLAAVTECSDMLPCAEDLGMVPQSVKGTLAALRILSLEIQRMPKQFGLRFDNLSENPYLSVSTIATHDMPPFRLWWKESEAAKAYWHEVLHRDGQPEEDPAPGICEEVVAMHLGSPSMLCLLSLQDWLAIDGRLRHPQPEKEQINHPSDPQQHWCYRMHLTLEQLGGDEAFRDKVRKLIAQSGRTA